MNQETKRIEGPISLSRLLGRRRECIYTRELRDRRPEVSFVLFIGLVCPVLVVSITNFAPPVFVFLVRVNLVFVGTRYKTLGDHDERSKTVRNDAVQVVFL